MTSKPQANKTIKSILTEYRIGFVVGDKDVDQHFKEFEQAITKAMLDALPEKKYILHLTGNDFREAKGYNDCLAEIRTAIKKLKEKL